MLLAPEFWLYKFHVARGEGPGGGKIFVGRVTVRFWNSPPLSYLDTHGSRRHGQEGIQLHQSTGSGPEGNKRTAYMTRAAVGSPWLGRRTSCASFLDLDN